MDYFDYGLFGILIVIIILLCRHLGHPITFISARDGKKIFKRNFLCQFMNYQNCNTMFLEFTEADKEKISKLLKESKAVPKHTRLNLIKIDDSRNWPFTVEKYIVLPSSLINTFDQASFDEIIPHELIHLKQRKNQKEFNKYYESLGFERVPTYRIKANTDYNPDDEPGVKWIYPVSDMTYILPAMVKNQQKIILLRIRNKDGFYEEEQSWPFDKSPYNKTIKNIWQRRFPDLDFNKIPNKHSPNEVVADLPAADFNLIPIKT